MSFKAWLRLSVVAFAAGFVANVAAQQPLYGPPISADNAKKVAAAALAEARKNSFNMAVAVVDSTGHLVYFERMDTVQFGSIAIAQDKASSAVYGMPKAAAELQAATEILPLERIGPRLVDLLSQRVNAHG